MSDGFDGCDFCRRQALKVEELNERIRQLEAQLYGSEWEPPAELRLTGMQTKIVQAMYAAGDRPLDKDFLVEASRTQRCNMLFPDAKIIDVVVCKIRQRLRPFGLEIETVWGRGYRLSADTRTKLLNWPSRTEKQPSPEDRAA